MSTPKCWGRSESSGKKVEVQVGGILNAELEGGEIIEMSSVGGVGEEGDQPRYCDSKNGKVAARVQVWLVVEGFCVDEGIVKDMYWRRAVAGYHVSNQITEGMKVVVEKEGNLLEFWYMKNEPAPLLLMAFE